VSFHDAEICRVERRGSDLVLTLDGVEVEASDSHAAGPDCYQLNGRWFALRKGTLIFYNARAVVINDTRYDEIVRENCSGEILSLGHEPDGRVRLASLWDARAERFELWLFDCDDVEWAQAVARK
jgi:hypothetical protein